MTNGTSDNLTELLAQINNAFPEDEISKELKDIKSNIEEIEKTAAFLIKDKPSKGDQSLAVNGEIITTKTK